MTSIRITCRERISQGFTESDTGGLRITGSVRAGVIGCVQYSYKSFYTVRLRINPFIGTPTVGDGYALSRSSPVYRDYRHTVRYRRTVVDALLACFYSTTIGTVR